MAQVELCHGQNERRIAQEIIVTQQQTAAMRLAAQPARSAQHRSSAKA
jgi:hypothetical protein